MDQLSDLPDAILHHIFSCMPVQDVVKTTVLSKRWKNLWISVPNLFFDHHSDPSPQSRHHFADFVNRTLIFRGHIKIKSFRIRLFLNARRNRTDLDLWIRYALTNDVEELFLDMSGDGSFYGLPQFLYVCSSVKILTLIMCSISFARQISWSSLKSLRFCHVCLWSDVIQTVLLGCPNLELLEVSYCDGFNGLSTNSTKLKELMITLDLPLDEPEVDEPEVRIVAPNVMSLHLSGQLYRKCLLVDMSSLVHATIIVRAKLDEVEGFDDHQNMLFDIIRSLKHVENLTLGSWCIKVLAIREKKGWSSPPSGRKCLTLLTRIMQEDLLGILHLLKSSTSLEKLVIDMVAFSVPEGFSYTSEHRRVRALFGYNYEEDILYSSKLGEVADFLNFGGDNYLASQKNIVNCLLHHLKIVNISHFVDQNCVFALVDFLLKKAKVLESMVIRAKEEASSSSESLFRTSQKLLAIPRSSPGAVVMLLK